jgi:hypothetical protein
MSKARRLDPTLNVPIMLFPTAAVLGHSGHVKDDSFWCNQDGYHRRTAFLSCVCRLFAVSSSFCSRGRSALPRLPVGPVEQELRELLNN